MNIILTGFMGTGKTVVGRRLARRLGWQFVDLDAMIESRAGMPITRVFAERGEVVFRRLERRCITRLIHEQRQVIATGGGAFVNPQNRAKLRVSGPVICLTSRPERILARVGRRLATRPLLAGSVNPLARIRSLLQQRASAYAQADVTLDTSDLSVDEVVERLWRRLGPYLCPSWQYLQEHAPELAHRYGGRYVVVVRDRILASGQTQLEAYQKVAGRVAEQRDVGIYYIPLPEESLTAF